MSVFTHVDYLLYLLYTLLNCNNQANALGHVVCFFFRESSRIDSILN